MLHSKTKKIKGKSQFVQSELNCATVPDIYNSQNRKKTKISEYESSKLFDNINKSYKDEENSDISIVYENSQKYCKRKVSCDKCESPSLQPEFYCPVYKAKKKKKHSKEIETLQNKYLPTLENIDESKKKIKKFGNSEISVLHDKEQPNSGKYMDLEYFLEKPHENSEGSIEYDTSQEEKSHKKKNKKKCKELENYEGSKYETSQEKSHKKKKKGKSKGLKKSEGSVDYDTSQEPSINAVEKYFSKNETKFKNNESYENHVILNQQPDPNGILIPDNVYQQKKRKRNYQELNVPECEMAALENMHEKKTTFVSVSEANSPVLDENDLGIKENYSSVILGNPKKSKEVKDFEISMDYERNKKPQKRKRNFDGIKDSNVLKCESSLENSYKKKMNKITPVSVIEANSSESAELIDDDFGTKEKNRSIILDYIEEPVKFPIPPLHEKESLKALTKEEKDFLKSQGVEIKLGKFSCSEDAILRKNYEEFCSAFRVNDPCFLLGIGRNKKPEAGVLNFLKAKHFYVRLGRDLNNRSLYSIYQRARILFNPFRTNKIQKCDEEDLKEVMYYQKKLGNKWTQIGAFMEKSNLKVRKCFEWKSEDIKKGDWAPEEEDILIKAIHSLVKIPNLSGRHSNLIPKRNASQCRLHWGECMAWEPDAKRLPWSKGKDEELVEELVSRGKINEYEIEWEDVHKCFKDFAPSHMFLRKRFRKLKTKKKFQYILKKSGLLLEGHKLQKGSSACEN